MLHSIRITKLFGRFDYELSFPNEGIMIVTGPNGYGKSTILRIINHFCNNNLLKVLSYSFKKLVFVCDNKSIHIVKNKNTFMIDNHEFPYPEMNSYTSQNDKRMVLFPTIRKVGKDDYLFLRNSEVIQLPHGLLNQFNFEKLDIVEQSIVFSMLDSLDEKKSQKAIKNLIFEINSVFNLIKEIQNDIGKVHFIQEQRLIEKREIHEADINQSKTEYITVIFDNSEKLKFELNEVMKKHSTLSSNLDSTYIKRLFQANRNELPSSEVSEKLRELEKKQEKLKKYGLADIENASYLNKLDENKLRMFGIELSIYLEDANAKYEVFEGIIDKLELFEQIVNEKLTFKKMALSRNEGIVVKSDEGVPLSLNDLSSGEQEIIVLFYKLIFESDVNLLLIDEPEISLHIAWQKELMENLKSVVNLKKDIQVIIATHSPQIISNNWDLQIDLGGQYNG
jgi:predicted ATP-binding protein involved in virulence